MKVPEEIALIGGGILLSSGLIFGLRSGAASTLPNVEHTVEADMQGKSYQQIQKDNDQKAPNLVSTSNDEVRTAHGWNDDRGMGYSFQAQKGKKYNISSMIDGDSGGYLEIWTNNLGIYSGNGIINNLNSGQLAMPSNPSKNYRLVQGTWTSDRNATVYIRYATAASGWADWKNVCVTQTDSYVPFETAQRNKNDN